ncbi:hypothetical protein niasHS_014069 [Heterodera schachtii]|uniref:Uncharacterized protein n=1 Tax=Heterodera schachtii TaxID=97005 RepID=A0ABD2INZ0_HETSC
MAAPSIRPIVLCAGYRIFLANMEDFRTVNEAFKSNFIVDSCPARSICQLMVKGGTSTSVFDSDHEACRFINCNIMVANMDNFLDVNETFKDFVTPDTYPVRSFFQVFKLPKNALVMIDAVATVSFGEEYAETANLRNITSVN